MDARTAVQQPKGPTTTGANRLIQRTCACGNHRHGGACAECEKKRIQPRLIINTPGDALEEQAERVAHEVTTNQRAGGDFSGVPAYTNAASSQWVFRAPQRLPKVAAVGEAAWSLQRAADPDEREAEAGRNERDERTGGRERR